MRNPKFFQDSNVVWRITFYSDDLKTTTVDPAVVGFQLQRPSGGIVTVTPVDEPGTGKYSASYVLDEYGLWDWRWKTDGPRIVDQGVVEVIQNVVV